MKTKIVRILCVTIAMSVSSCKDACKNKCQNGSSCLDGTCVCDSAHVGQYCESLYCEVNHFGYIKFSARYTGYFILYFSDSNGSPQNFPTVRLNWQPWVNDYDTSKIVQFPITCYKVAVIHWQSIPGTPADTTFDLYPCVEQCKTTEIVLQRL